MIQPYGRYRPSLTSQVQIIFCLQIFIPFNRSQVQIIFCFQIIIPLDRSLHKLPTNNFLLAIRVSGSILFDFFSFTNNFRSVLSSKMHLQTRFLSNRNVRLTCFLGQYVRCGNNFEAGKREFRKKIIGSHLLY